MLLASAAPAQLQPPVAEPGTVEGVVEFPGKVPLSQVADDGGRHRPLLEINARTRGVRFVVAHLAAEEPAGPALTDATNSFPPMLIDQVDHAFTPHLTAVRGGQPVVFTNSDPANHNVRTTSALPTNQFNVFTGGGGGHYQHRFVPEAQDRPVRLDCDLHPWMRGWIYVFDHPLFATTDSAGKFVIHPVPSGRYRLVLRQPDVRFEYSLSIEVKAGQTNTTTVRIPEKPGAGK